MVRGMLPPETLPLLTLAKTPWLGLKYVPLGVFSNFTARTMYTDPDEELSLNEFPVTRELVIRVKGPAALEPR